VRHRAEEDRWVAARAGGRRAPVGSARGVREPVGRWTKHDRWGAAQAGGAVGWGVRGRAVSEEQEGQWGAALTDGAVGWGAGRRAVSSGRRCARSRRVAARGAAGGPAAYFELNRVAGSRWSRSG
jgi:hypothetical protein